MKPFNLRQLEPYHLLLLVLIFLLIAPGAKSMAAELKLLNGHSDAVRALAYSRDGRLLASGGTDRSIKLWDVAAVTLIHSWVFPVPVKAVAFSPDGRRLAATGCEYSSSTDYTHCQLRVWDLSNYRELQQEDLGAGQVSHMGALAYSPDGKYLALQLQQLELRNPENLALIKRFDAEHFGFSSDGKRLAMRLDKGMGIWDFQTQKMQQFDDPPKRMERDAAWFRSLAISPDGRWLAAGFDHSNQPSDVVFWDSRSGRYSHSLNLAAVPVVMDFSPDGNHLVLGLGQDFENGDSQDIGHIGIWPFQPSTFPLQPAQLETAPEIQWQTQGNVIALAVQAQGNQLAVGTFGHQLKLLHFDGKQFNPQASLTGSGYEIRRLELSPDGRLMASLSGQDTRIWDTVTGKQLYQWPIVVDQIRFSPDNARLVMQAPDGRIFQMLLSEGKLIKLYQVDVEYPEDFRLAFYNQGRSVGVMGFSGLTALFDLEQNKAVGNLKDPGEGDAETFDISPDGRWLARGLMGSAYANYNGQSFMGPKPVIFLHDARTGKDQVLQSVKKHGYSYPAAAFSPNGKWLATQFEGNVEVWSLEPQKKLAKWSVEGSGSLLAFSPDSRFLAASCAIGEKRETYKTTVWSLESLATLATIKAEQEIYSLAFSPGGKNLLTGEVNLLQSWNLHTGQLTASHELLCEPVCQAKGPCLEVKVQCRLN